MTSQREMATRAGSIIKQLDEAAGLEANCASLRWWANSILIEDVWDP